MGPFIDSMGAPAHGFRSAFPALLVFALLPHTAFAGPFGRDVESRWDEGSRAEARGDFAAARRAYEIALQASTKIPLDGRTAKQLAILKDCAALGSRARIAGARAGEGVLPAGKPPEPAAVRRAVDRATEAFRRAVTEEEKARPDLANACP